MYELSVAGGCWANGLNSLLSTHNCYACCSNNDEKVFYCFWDEISNWSAFSKWNTRFGFFFRLRCCGQSCGRARGVHHDHLPCRKLNFEHYSAGFSWSTTGRVEELWEPKFCKFENTVFNSLFADVFHWCKLNFRYDVHTLAWMVAGDRWLELAASCGWF